MASAVGRLAVAVPFAFVTATLDGWVLTKLWAWFVVPVFAVAALGIAQAVGLRVAASALTGVAHLANSKALRRPDRGWAGIAESITISLLTPLFILLTGWAVHLFL